MIEKCYFFVTNNIHLLSPLGPGQLFSYLLSSAITLLIDLLLQKQEQNVYTSIKLKNQTDLSEKQKLQNSVIIEQLKSIATSSEQVLVSDVQNNPLAKFFGSLLRNQFEFKFSTISDSF